MIPEERLDQIRARFEYLEARLNAGAAVADLAALSREYAELKPVVAEIDDYRRRYALYKSDRHLHQCGCNARIGRAGPRWKARRKIDVDELGGTEQRHRDSHNSRKHVRHGFDCLSRNQS